MLGVVCYSSLLTEGIDSEKRCLTSRVMSICELQDSRRSLGCQVPSFSCAVHVHNLVVCQIASVQNQCNKVTAWNSILHNVVRLIERIVFICCSSIDVVALLPPEYTGVIVNRLTQSVFSPCVNIEHTRIVHFCEYLLSSHACIMV